MNSQFDIKALDVIVKIVARKRHHIGHARLNFDDLCGEGHVLIARLINENPGIPQGRLEALLRTSFENKIIDLRREYCLNRRHGAKTVQMSVLTDMKKGPKVTGGADAMWDPGEDASLYGGPIRLHKLLDSVMDLRAVIKKIEGRLTPSETRVFRAIVLDELNEIDTIRKTNFTRHTVRSATWKIRSVARQVLKEVG